VLNIGVLGSGLAGQTLATGFLGRGHPVMIGSRNPAKLHGWLRTAGPGGRVGTFAETARFADVAVLSVLGTAAEDVIRLAGVENFSGKVVIDAATRLTSPPDGRGCSWALQTPSANASSV
jgi:8-hydroxy-5-deazaflavin:NADPH oxidoreductase